MALATSGAINLTDVRDFYGQSGSINMTNLHKGESNIPNPTTYGSATEGKGSTVGSTSGSIQSGASYLTSTNPKTDFNDAELSSAYSQVFVDETLDKILFLWLILQLKKLFIICHLDYYKFIKNQV